MHLFYTEFNQTKFTERELSLLIPFAITVLGNPSALNIPMVYSNIKTNLILGHDENNLEAVSYTRNMHTLYTRAVIQEMYNNKRSTLFMEKVARVRRSN
jgi:hypothetical protein